MARYTYIAISKLFNTENGKNFKKIFFFNFRQFLTFKCVKFPKYTITKLNKSNFLKYVSHTIRSLHEKRKRKLLFFI